ncbi:MAG: hypothetical protein ABR518_09395 [Actinomycetota bacterium]
MARKPIHERDTVGVFHDRRDAEEAAEAAERAGVPPEQIRIDDPADEVTSLRGEMREEIDQTMVGPGVGPITKEARRRLLKLVPLTALAGAILVLPAAFLPIDMSLTARLLIAAAVGVTAGATLGLVLGGGLGMWDRRGPGSKLAAERGTTVGIKTSGPRQAGDVVERIEGEDPIRVDLTTSERGPTGVAATEEETPEGRRHTG